MSRKSRRGRRKGSPQRPPSAPSATARQPVPPSSAWGALLSRLPWRARRQSPPSLSREASLQAVPYRDPRLHWELREPDQGTGHPVPVAVLRVPRRQDGWRGLLNRWVAGPDHREVILDELGTDVWELCDGEASVEAIIRELAQRHRLGRREVELSLTEYLRTLAVRGFISLRMPGTATAPSETDSSP